MLRISTIRQNISFRQAPFQAEVDQLGSQTKMPDNKRNYCEFNMPLVEKLVQNATQTTPLIEKKLLETKDEKVLAEGLYTFDRMIEAGKFDINKTYPTLSKLNKTQSPSAQVLLAGIYRKTQPPDAFGPLNSMMIKNAITPPIAPFDPNEEIGGAILEYLRSAASNKVYEC